MPRRAKFSLKDPQESTAIRIPNSVHARLLKAGVTLGLGKFDEKNRFAGAPAYEIVRRLLDIHFGDGGPV